MTRSKKRPFPSESHPVSAKMALFFASGNTQSHTERGAPAYVPTNPSYLRRAPGRRRGETDEIQPAQSPFRSPVQTHAPLGHGRRLYSRYCQPVRRHGIRPADGRRLSRANLLGRPLLAPGHRCTGSSGWERPTPYRRRVPFCRNLSTGTCWY